MAIIEKIKKIKQKEKEKNQECADLPCCAPFLLQDFV